MESREEKLWNDKIGETINNLSREDYYITNGFNQLKKYVLDRSVDTKRLRERLLSNDNEEWIDSARRYCKDQGVLDSQMVAILSRITSARSASMQLKKNFTQ